jgi:hypothetical protein
MSRILLLTMISSKKFRKDCQIASIFWPPLAGLVHYRVIPSGAYAKKGWLCGELSTPLETVKPVRRTLVNLYSTCILTSCYPLTNQCCHTSGCACFHSCNILATPYSSLRDKCRKFQANSLMIATKSNKLPDVFLKLNKIAR